MSQKFIKKVNKNPRSMAYGKCFAHAIYDKNFVGTKTLADFIQTQASVKRSDVIAVLDELGGAMKHFFEMGQKVKLEGASASSRWASPASAPTSLRTAERRTSPRVASCSRPRPSVS